MNLSHLFIGRALGGVGVGALRSVNVFIYSKTNYIMNPSMLSPLYMAEISPPEVRGSLMALEQLSIVLGVVFGFWTGFITRSSMCISNIACSYHRSPDLTVSLSLNSSRFFVMARSARHPNHPRYHPRFRLLFPPPISPTIGSTPEVR